MANSILDMFASSPIRPMQDHMSKVHQAAKQLVPFFEAALAKDWQEAEKIKDEIRQLENDADDLKHGLRMQLPKGLFLPVARTDLLSLLSKQDKIANIARDISGLVFARKMEFPENIHSDLLGLVKRSIDASKQAFKAINELDELLATGFRGREADLVEELVSQLDVIENDTDELQRALLFKIFEQEEELPPVAVMFMYKVIRQVGDLADSAQSVGSRFEMTVAR
ncbi:TIGR00153 family protein [Kangiella japonica]|uniref:TIGR00153 family protein n=1 Tax=Kangiella japonica TaxID=647384 RepID=A0ABN0SX79_9GAMM